ncbi:MAG TPA: hypothetical protein VMF86_11390 [Stellaceae bacterium]|nr:hypothetical protein [Stellaceae bacterium]
MSGTRAPLPTELEMLRREIAWLGVYVWELQELEQLDMPSERRERALRIRQAAAPMFFNFVSSVFRDALIQGLANILDPASTGGHVNLTLEWAIQNHAGPADKARLIDHLNAIRAAQTCESIRKSRNKMLSHTDYDTIKNYDSINAAADFPGMRLDDLRTLIWEIVTILSAVTGLEKCEFCHEDWRGVHDLFAVLESKGSKSA